MVKKNKNTETDSKLPRKNRNGIVVFDNNEDFFTLFTKPVSDSVISFDSQKNFDPTISFDPQNANSKKNSDSQNSDSQNSDSQNSDSQNSDSQKFFDFNKNQEQTNNIKNTLPLRRDKHGLPFLDGTRSISKMFIEADSKKEDENFAELIETVLKGKDKDAMMREKSDRAAPEPVPLKKRLKCYPPPQDEMDLHGYTAKEAETKAESYIRNCWRNGFFTVQIIVGKGIHSPYGAVLPDVVEDLLTRLKREGVLLWFEWDKRTKSQSGAVIAYLKQFS
ncbi:MAG: Smr/MutS family protein [Desulfamplus sp.]|nr:Smr/MutS family protein [Desulfamplus sp.]